MWATKEVVTLDLNNASLNQFLDCFRYSAIIFPIKEGPCRGQMSDLYKADTRPKGLEISESDFVVFI